MAFMSGKLEGEIRVVLSVDTCVKADKDGYKAYLDSFKGEEPDESLLKLEGIPTRFVMKREIPYAKNKKVRSNNVKIHGKKLDINVNLPADTVQIHLCGIENPPDIPDNKRVDFKVEAGVACDAIMAKLDRAGAIGDLFTALQNARGGEGERVVEKKD